MQPSGSLPPQLGWSKAVVCLLCLAAVLFLFFVWFAVNALGVWLGWWKPGPIY